MNSTKGTVIQIMGPVLDIRFPADSLPELAQKLGLQETTFMQTLTDYNRRVIALVSSGKLDEVPLLPETFRSYLEMRPFDALNQRIAASNQAEIYPASLLPFLRVLQNMGLETLADVQKLISENEDDAYLFALSQLAITDLDIVSENVGLLNLCVVHVLKQGGGRAGLKAIYDQLNGYRPENQTMADMMMEQALELPFMGGSQQKKP